MSEYAELHLKKGEEARLKAGHSWVFSNEIDIKKSPLKQFEPGELVTLLTAGGKPMGVAYVNPNTLISARLLTRAASFNSKKWLKERLEQAQNMREQFTDKPFYRWCYGESDGIPGLVVDRYGSVVVVQFNTVGIEALREEVLAAIDAVAQPDVILLRNDSSMRELEGLPTLVEVVKGDLPETVQLEENGAKFLAALDKGQKTGWFYDHRDNRRVAASLAKGKRVLDVFSYLGGWGVLAAHQGASEVHCVDSSASACELIGKNAALNGVEDKVSVHTGKALDILQAMRAEGEKFDMVILDPPAFIKRKKDVKNGLAGYQRINQMAMQLIKYDGMLFTSSCSYHLQDDSFNELINRSARHIDRQLQLFYQGGQSWDHPVVPAIPETRYIKSLGMRVIRPC